MDENKVVTHTGRDRTAEGVTPSDPNAIVNLFQEMSIGERWGLDPSSACWHGWKNWH